MVFRWVLVLFSVYVVHAGYVWSYIGSSGIKAVLNICALKCYYFLSRCTWNKPLSAKISKGNSKTYPCVFIGFNYILYGEKEQWQ